ncbi:DUF4190 domain-containing protein [Streptomyces vilmorinianum]|uniref:DUF4190 domain-containing protein n=1 Tax=Streptomyces vilmorinianum TaxID=3051092 RepID=UPI00158635F0|nr:DUF4190 domain-containing protein [Streptomyces vilmorinianum]
MEPSQPPQDPQPPQQGWPAPEPSNPYGAPVGGALGPYAPYGPYGPGAVPGPYGTPPPGTNGLAIASLVSGVVCCLPPLGLIFGLIALPQIKKKNQTGKGLAIAGIVLSSISCLLLVLGLVTGGFGEAWKGFKEGMDEASRADSAFSLRTGQCYNVDGDVEAYTSDVEVVDCAQPHEGEVTGGFSLKGFTKWPGDKAIDDLATGRCETIGAAYAMDTWAFPDDVYDFYYYPSRASWRAGDRTVTCSFIVDGGDPLKGSLRSDATTLDAHQFHFLRSVNPIDTALTIEPEEDADVDLAVNTAWAREVHTAVVRAARDLKTHQWPGASATQVAGLVKELEASAGAWDKLALAADEDAFWERYDTAYDSLPSPLGGDARTALGLAGGEESAKTV